MLKTFYIGLLFVALSWQKTVLGQTSVFVNPDGTHTVVHNYGTHAVAVNAGGTHTVIHHGTSYSVAVNPGGSHSVIHHNSSNSVLVNPDGTHTIIPHNMRRSNAENETHPHYFGSPNFWSEALPGHGGAAKQLKRKDGRVKKSDHKRH